jgi:hypothetical protein
MTPIFIFSLPRAGSTLLQRVLATAPKIATSAEPWLLLPLIYARKKEGIYAEYGHNVQRVAIDDFVMALPRGEEDYRACVRKMIYDLYRLAAGEEAEFFVDKTPRYHLVASEIIELFPDAKFVFLWRNPLAIAASMIETWGDGRWKLHSYKVDLYSGLEKLVATYNSYKDRSIAVCYEDLVSGNLEVWRSLYEYLGVPFVEESLDGFNQVELVGSMGDPTGRYQYAALSKEPLCKWRDTMASPIRAIWSRRYLHWVGPDRLRSMGYEPSEIVRDLRFVGPSLKYLASDCARIAYGVLYAWLEPAMVRDKLRMWKEAWRIHAHR